MNSEEQPEEQYQQGEVIEQRNFTFVIRLDDGRVLPHCFIGRDMKACVSKSRPACLGSRVALRS